LYIFTADKGKVGGDIGLAGEGDILGEDTDCLAEEGDTGLLVGEEGSKIQVGEGGSKSQEVAVQAVVEEGSRNRVVVVLVGHFVKVVALVAQTLCRDSQRNLKTHEDLQSQSDQYQSS